MNKIKQYLSRCYGVDAFGRFLVVIAIIVYGLSFLIFSTLFNFVFMVIMIYSLIRVFSHNYSQRASENAFYLNKSNKIRLAYLHLMQKKTHCFFTCSNCQQIVRVPKHKGNIVIHCPKCRHQFDAKT